MLPGPQTPVPLLFPGYLREHTRLASHRNTAELLGLWQLWLKCLLNFSLKNVPSLFKFGKQLLVL